MKNLVGKFVDGRNTKLSAMLVVGILIFVGLGCFGGKSSSSKPVPPEYFGVWTGQDGTLITIRSDGKGDYKSGGTTVDGGTVAIDDAKKELSVTFLGIGPTKKIDSPPSGGQMTLDGMIYKRNGGNSDDKGGSQAEKKSPLADKSNDTDNKSAAPSDDAPSDDEMQDMARTAMMDFNDAVQQRDFTDFFSTVSKVWQRSTSPAKLKNSFQVFIDKKIDLSQIRTLNANFSGAPTYDDSYGFHEMTLDGRYETRPLPTKFTLSYTKEDGKWKLAGMRVKTNED